ncbi:LOW QUALITY PROTEIN: pleiotropic drug resistance protein 3-like [Lycium barbarum]|uniref:LOW QUALITY PROTEIN: pleiotropic drug resistance protein 3-like n=1 Tax=Lycium barbarum TaxID=112863 RepID=UPI00293F468C|nr:LOW QUALITY PROTEIN: pleiotropic drug resistance protein 3-like [Lycium barbarum]
MAQLFGSDDIESIRMDLSEIGRSLRSSFRRQSSSFRSNSALSASEKDDVVDEENMLAWAAIERLPTFDRLRSSVFEEINGNEANVKTKRVTDVTKLGAVERHVFIEKMIKHIEHDNLQMLHKIRKRIDKVGVELPTVEVRFENLTIEAECELVQGKPLPTLWNSLKSIMMEMIQFAQQNLARLPGLQSEVAKIKIINDVSGVIKPGRMTLLLGPPGCGKTTLLKALSGNLDKSLEVSGEIFYNGYKLDEFVPQKTSAYISQNDLHIHEMTVRETLDYSSRFQGVGSRSDIMIDLSRREKEAGIVPDADIDTYMKAISVEGQKTNLQTDYILKILGLDICADTLVGDAMRRGISGGQKKRLTTGELMVGPTKALFMDEISNGLDSSTTYQIVACLQQLAHITDATILVSLLQPTPETFDLFDDIILMAEGKILYHGPRNYALEFFESCGLKCPERKGVADFLQEVTSRKDQAQYWHGAKETYRFVSVDTLSRKFKESPYRKKLNEELSVLFDNSRSHRNSVTFRDYSLPKWELFRACISREFLLMKRNSFIYIFKTLQLVIIASISMTVFVRTPMDTDLVHANYYMGALFYALVILLVDGFPELSMTITRLAVFYKQNDLCFYPAWAYAIPATILKIPLSLLESVIWTCLTYYVIGFSPEAGRFFRQLLLLFAVHMTSISMFRFLASVCRTIVASAAAGSLSVLFVFLFSGFIIPRHSMPIWLKWAFWISPLTYGEIGLSVNEFLAPRWQKTLATNTTIGNEVLESHGLNFNGYFYWVSVCALFGLTILFNIGFTLALTYLKAPGSRAIISAAKYSQIEGSSDSFDKTDAEENSKTTIPRTTMYSHEEAGRMVLPFEPLSLVFQDVQYYIDTPMAMKELGFAQNRLQLLSDITGALRPGVLTALMGVSGAGKTTLLDVLAGRKTSGYVEGEIKVGGYPKVQETFARVSGYCEQTDIHSPQITVEESVIFSARLRLHPQIDSKTKYEFVKEVLETTELDGIKDMLVGMPVVSGLSTEQRKRLTIAVELVANPSIIFMDEPTTGLDARSAAIVMRAVKNVAETARTIVCTIHQPSIDIFEAFDELILLKTGGRMIYWGPLGQNSCKMIEYFEGISGVPKIKNNFNPATYMLEVTSTSNEAEISVDFAEVYKNSALHKNNEELVKNLSFPPAGSKDLHFPTRFSQNGWGQFKTCFWKQYLSYWRSPSYNLIRSLHMLFASVVFGLLFWDKAKKLDNQQSVFSIFGAMFSAVMFCGINNSSSVLPYVTTERSVLYRERFAGMYASWAYALAQVAIEIPYLLVQALAYTVITYPMMGFYWSAYKVFWYFYSMFCTLLYFTYLGMMLVSMTPNFPVAATLQSSFYTMFNLFAGFLMPKAQIPKWWIWFYYLIPTSWTLNGMLTSQYGDVQTEITVFGEKKTVAAFIRDYFGFHHNQLPIVAVVLIAYPLVFAILFAFFIRKLNFQRR